MKLTVKQKKNIVAAYSAGGVSMATLAAKYGVSEKTICKVIHADEKFTEKVREEKKQAERSMLAYLASRKEKAQSLIDSLLDIPPDMIKSATLRDRMGALKILTECFAVSDETVGNGAVSVYINLADTSGGEESGDGNGV